MEALLAFLRRWPSAVVAGGALLLLVISVAAFESGNNWAALLGIALVAWPLWQFRVERMHVARRAHLEEITLPHTRLRRWFWRGTASSLWQAVPAFGGGVLLLLLTGSLQFGQWLLLAADAALLVFLLQRYETHPLLSGIKPAHRRSVGRRWLFGLNVALLALAFALLEYFHYGMPDTRDIPWRQLALGTFDTSLQQNGGSLFSGWIALATAGEQLLRHGVLVYAPTLSGPWLRTATYFCMALYFAAGTWLLSRYFLGAQAIFDHALSLGENEPEPAQSDSPPPQWKFSARWAPQWKRWLRRVPVEFLAVMLGFVLVLVSWGDSIHTFSRGQEKWLRRAVGVGAVLTDPCGRHGANIRGTQALVQRRLDAAEQRILDEAKATVHTTVGAAFDQARSGVDPFLDWYYSLAGDATRFAATFLDRAGDGVEAEVHQRFIAPVQGLEGSVSAQVSGRLNPLFLGTLKQLETDLQGEISAQNCLRFKLNLPALVTARDQTRWVSSALVTFAIRGLLQQRATLTAAGFAERTAIRATGRTIAKAAVRRAGQLLFPVAGGTVFCALLAPVPLAFLGCEGAVFVTSWLGTEYLALKLDEVFHRDEMRNKMLADLNREQAEIEKAFNDQVEQMVRAEVGRLRLEVNKTFVPARDGA